MFSVNEIKKKEIDVKKARESLKESLDNLTYDFGDGRVIQTRPQDHQNLLGKIEVISKGGSNKFIMANNQVASVTIPELEAAIASGVEKASVLWDQYMAVVDPI